MIEFDVDIATVPVELDKKGKDVIVNWKMYDGFDGKGTFWTDANGLDMQERKINHRPMFDIMNDRPAR